MPVQSCVRVIPEVCWLWPTELTNQADPRPCIHGHALQRLHCFWRCLAMWTWSRAPCSFSLWPAQDLTEQYVGKAMQQHVRVGADGKIKWEEAPSELRHFHWSSRDGP